MTGREWWRSPWVPSAASAVPVALALWSVSVPGGYFGVGLAALTCWAVVGLLWLVSGTLAVRALPVPRTRNLSRLRGFLAVPLLLAVTYATTGSGVVRSAAFAAERSSLELLVAEVRSTPDGRAVDRGFLLFTVSDAVLDPATGCALLTLRDTGFLDSTGYAHCPDGAPATAHAGEGYSFRHLDGPWYEFAFTW